MVADRAQAQAADLPAEMLRAVLDGCAVPLALVGADGIVLAANGALARSAGRTPGEIVGAALGDLVAGLPADLEAQARTGTPVPAVLRVEIAGTPGSDASGGEPASGGLRSCAVHLALAGAGRVVATVLPDSTGNQVLLDTALRRVEEQAGVQRALFDLSRQITLGSKEEELVGLFARTIRKLLPGSRLCVRLVDPDTHALRGVHASGRLREEAHERVAVRRKALQGAGLSLEPVPGGAVELADRYVPVFEGSTSGVDFPLSAGDRLLGVLNVESPAVTGEQDVDRAVLGTLANQMAVGLRNHRLYEETLYLKGFLENLVESAAALIVVVDRDRRIVRFNRALEELTGWSKDEVLGKPLTDWLPAEARGRVMPALIGAMLGEPQGHLDVQLPTRAGKLVPVVMQTAVVYDPRGDVGGIIAVGQDVSRIKDLEGRVQHAAKLATLGQVAAGIVHELNNPLTSISAYGEFLLKKAAQDPTRSAEGDRLRRIVEAADRIRRFCQDLMAYARPSAGSVHPLHINQILDESLGFCEHVLDGASVRVTRDLAPDLPQIYGVRDQLQQVFVNLCTNASHAMDGRPNAELVVSTHCDGTTIQVVISDNGVGIPDTDLSRIWDPFFTTKREGKGTGLGLPLARELVENHSGKIEVRSRVGVGTAFTLSFPIAR